MGRPVSVIEVALLGLQSRRLVKYHLTEEHKNIMDETAVLNTAITIAEEAGAIIAARFGQSNHEQYKGAVDPVTEADLASERHILARLSAAFPNHLILAEESGGSDWHTPAPIWLIDPLDGTVNFAHHFPHFCVSLALVVEGEILLGVTHDPLRRETFAALRGGGATCNGRPLRVGPRQRLADALLVTGFPYDRRTAFDNNAQRVDPFLRRSQGLRRTGSACLDLAYIAAGRLDGYWELRLKPWDVAAGILLVREAGGVCTDFSGNAETARLLSGAEMVASNGLFHHEMLQVLRMGNGAPLP